MRAGWIGAALAVGMMASVGTAQAQQSPLDGPLAAPGEAPAPTAAPAKARPHKTRHAKAKVAGKPAKQPAAAQDAAAPRPEPGETPAARAGMPADGVDLGMKWNGNNDGAAQTRFQSGPNTTSGSGAEVGMKLHF